MAQTGKIAEVMFENFIETYEHQNKMVDLCDQIEPDEKMMQNANNVVWRPVQQHRPVLEGWDLTGQEQDIIEETYPSILEEPVGDFILQRADDLRDMTFWERAGKQSAMQQVTEQNKRITDRAVLQGSMFFTQSAATSTSGFDFLAEGQVIMNQRQSIKGDRCFLLNDRDNKTFANELAGRQTVQGMPTVTWETGQVANNVAEFDVYTESFLPNIVNNTSGGSTVVGDQSFAPEGGSVDTVTGQVTNVDYRSADVVVASSAAFNVGDKITFDTVESVGRADKNETNELMTFTVVGKDISAANTIRIYPKPIGVNDATLTALEQAYGNVVNKTNTNGAIPDGVNVNVLNDFGAAGDQKANLFWNKDAIEVISGTIPVELFKQYDGMQVITETMSNGQTAYMVYDANLTNMSFRYRLFVWYGITIAKPQDVGIGVTIP